MLADLLLTILKESKGENFQKEYEEWKNTPIVTTREELLKTFLTELKNSPVNLLTDNLSLLTVTLNSVLANTIDTIIDKQKENK